MMSGQFYIVNLGGTAATIQEVFYEFYIADSKSPLPAKRPWEGKSGLKCNVTLKPGCSSPYLFERQQPVSAEEFSYLAFRKKSLYIMGWIDYVDALKIRRTTRFCRLYDVDTDRFTAVEDAEYESAD